MIKFDNLTEEQIIELLDTYSSCQNLLNKRIEYLINELCMINEKHENAIEKYGKENCIAYLEANNQLFEIVNRELEEVKSIKKKYFKTKYEIFYTSNKTAVPSEKSTLSRGVETND